MEKEDQKWRDKYWWMFLAEKKYKTKQLAIQSETSTE